MLRFIEQINFEKAFTLRLEDGSNIGSRQAVVIKEVTPVSGNLTDVLCMKISRSASDVTFRGHG